MHEHWGELEEAGATSLFTYYDLNSGIPYPDIDLIFGDAMEDLYVLQGSFTYEEGVDAFDSEGMTLTDDYRGYQLGRTRDDYVADFVFADGLVIYVLGGYGDVDTRAAVEAVIDTMEGDIEPYTASIRQFDSAATYLDTDTMWWCHSHAESADLGLTYTRGSSLAVRDGEFRVRTQFALPTDADVTDDEVLDEVKQDRYLEYQDPTMSRTGNVVRFEEYRSFEEFA